MIVRRFENEDAQKVVDLIATTLRVTNIKDYSSEYIERIVEAHQPEVIIDRASWTHFYVICDRDQIVGSGAIGPFWGKEDESSLFSIFVHPDYQGKGLGKLIMETLEADEYFLRANRVEIPASITGTPFYLKFGYHYKNGVTVPDEEELLRLEKYR